ncbi:Tetratricopeptide repeat-like superfamily protein [Prunus dulcis]|uniref:Tetratricopeptide repeat-like superfamily protein n=1 Tax=Prunus dulcis TaxID=3755 RepID=A0A5H2XG14_PRUDU|nr:Tetratricopeptide repeat-like superfamily protein [Prunus dulcis]
MGGYCKEGNVHQALVLQEEMWSDRLSPNVFNVINAMCKPKNFNRAMEFFDQMRVRGLRPNERMYTTLIDVSTNRELESAFRMKLEMMDKGVSLDAVTYSSLIQVVCQQRRLAQTREARRLLLNLFYEESLPDDVTYITLIENCTNGEFKSAAALGLMKEAHLVFETMIERKHKRNEAVYHVIIHGHCKGGNVIKAYNLYKEMLHSGFVPHTVMVIGLVKALFTEGMNNELSQVIGNTLRNCQLSDAECAKLPVAINHKEGIWMKFLMCLMIAKNGLLSNSGLLSYKFSEELGDQIATPFNIGNEQAFEQWQI